MNNLQRSARLVGILFIIGTVSGILSLNMMSLLNAPDYLLKLSENKPSVIFSVFSILTMGVALSMMSVILYPILKKYNEALAIGAVVFRGVLEMASYLCIAIIWLKLLSLGQNFVLIGSPLSSEFPLMGDKLQNLIVIFGNIGLDIVFSIGTIIINYVFLKTKLLPSWLSIWGLVGAILYLSVPILLMFGFEFELLQVVLGLQEMVMAVWLIVKGFNKSAASTLLTNAN